MKRGKGINGWRKSVQVSLRVHKEPPKIRSSYVTKALYSRDCFGQAVAPDKGLTGSVLFSSEPLGPLRKHLGTLLPMARAQALEDYLSVSLCGCHEDMLGIALAAAWGTAPAQSSVPLSTAAGACWSF